MLGLWINPCSAQGVQINEFMSVNEDGIVDSDGDASDWIELFNASAAAVDLSGYTLTDDAAEPAKWTIPATTSLGAGGYLIVFASGKDRAVAGEELHANFKLGSGDGFLGLFDSAAVPAQVDAFTEIPDQREDVSYGLGVSDATIAQTYVADSADCKWFVPSEDIGSDWQMPGFADAAWTAAKLGLGYDYDDLTGENGNLRTAMQGENGSVYIRVPFEVNNPARVVALSLSMRFEDGFVAFLNGELIAAENNPEPLVWDSVATSSNPDAQAVVPAIFELSPADFAGRLVAGTNILAIQGMNGTRGGSDALFYPNLTGATLADGESSPGYFQFPTPGTANNAKVDGFVQDTDAAPKRGFYEAPVQVMLTNTTDGAAIYYTLDKTEPTVEDGTLYAGAITIDKTTILRAAAHKSGYVSSPIQTNTYIFLDDVVEQDDMHSSVTEDDELGPQLKSALVALPTISIVAQEDRDLISGSSGGGVPGRPQPEVVCSTEWLNPDGSEGFQIDCGISRFGGFFTTFDKKSYRLYFRKVYGSASLKYPAFDGFEYEVPPVDEFDSLSLRSGSHDMNQRGAYMSNRFADDTLLDMGQLAPHGRFVHLYINGVYWGQYHLRERWQAAMFARYFGGEKEDYEAINGDNSGDQFLTGNAYDGTGEMWQQARDLIRDGARADDTFNMAKTHIDIENYVSFMVMWGSGQSESEFRAAGGRSMGPPPESPLEVGFKFFLKDADGYLRGHSTGRATHNGPLNLFSEMRRDGDPEYLKLVGDLLHRYFFNDGPMTTANIVNRLQKRVDETKLSFIGEAARWSRSSNTGTGRTYSSWEREMNTYLTRNLPRVQDAMLTAYERAGIYPDIPAPVFSQHGGTIPQAGSIQVTADGVIYYTVDGSDPRITGGEANPAAVMIDGRGLPAEFIAEASEWKYLDDGSDQGTAWRDAGYDDSGWASGTGPLGYGNAVTTTLGFGGDSSSKFITTYFRKTFNAADVNRAVGLTAGIARDDGAIAYINGQEVVRDNIPAGAVTFLTPAASAVSGSDERDYFSFEIDPALLVEGENVLAVEVHQESANSSDMSFDGKLNGLYSQGTPTVVLAGPTIVKSRVFNGENWSALNEAFFAPQSAVPTSENLVISEIMYNPGVPTEGEIAAGFTNADSFEFVELNNISSETLNLGDLAFIDGIGVKVFAGKDSFLEAGARVLVVKNLEAFTLRYGAGISVIGTFTGNLRNSGEKLELVGPAGSIRAFEYGDNDPWPADADGNGASLELISPMSNPDHALATSWRASVPGGTPGTGDSVVGASYATWRSTVFSAAELADASISGDAADSDGDGLSVFMEFATGGLPTAAEFDLGLAIFEEAGEQRISYVRALNASGLSYQIEGSATLTGWEGAGGSFSAVETVPVSATSERVVLRYSGGGVMSGYFRLRVNALQQ